MKGIVLLWVVGLVPSEPPASPPASPPRSPPADRAAVRDEGHRARQRREAAEDAFRLEAIRFGEEILVYATGYPVSGSRRWFAYQGKGSHRLDGEEFYQAIERPDLVDAYRRRRRIGYGTLIAGGAVSLAGLYLFLGPGDPGTPPFRFCSSEPPSPECEAQRQAELAAYDRKKEQSTKYKVAGMLGMLVGAVPFFVGTYYIARPHPISEDEARQLGAEHNSALRRKHDLSRARARRPARDVAWQPYVEPSGAGLAVLGQF